MPPVFTISDRSEPDLLLQLNDIRDVAVLQRAQLRIVVLPKTTFSRKSAQKSHASVLEPLWTMKATNVLGTEGRPSLRRGHDYFSLGG